MILCSSWSLVSGESGPPLRLAPNERRPLLALLHALDRRFSAAGRARFGFLLKDGAFEDGTLGAETGTERALDEPV